MVEQKVGLAGIAQSQQLDHPFVDVVVGDAGGRVLLRKTVGVTSGLWVAHGS